MVGDELSFAVVVAAHDANPAFFKDTLASVSESEYPYREVHVVDSCPGLSLSSFSAELFPGDANYFYHTHRETGSMAALWNTGIRSARADYILFVGPDARLSKNALEVFAAAIRSHPEAEFVYSDFDEIEGGSRQNPYFLPDFNLELLRHENYIGGTFCVKRTAFAKLGTFSEKLEYAFAYEFFLRIPLKKVNVLHVPSLLWHRRVVRIPKSLPAVRAAMEKSLREHMTALSASFQAMGIDCTVRPGRDRESWSLRYDGSDIQGHEREYILIHEKDARVFGRKARQKLWAHMKRPDVAIVGCRYYGTDMRLLNAGYIFDKNGFSFPACHSESIFSRGLYNRITTAQEVSMVDMSYCMIDAKFFKKSGGLDRRLTGRDQMLDLCLRALEGGRKVIYEPSVVVRQVPGEVISQEASHRRLMEKWGSVIEKGDRYYSPNLPAGLLNYRLSVD